jgi:hypothetical protein
MGNLPFKGRDLGATGSGDGGCGRFPPGETAKADPVKNEKATPENLQNPKWLIFVITKQNPYKERIVKLYRFFAGFLRFK